MNLQERFAVIRDADPMVTHDFVVRSVESLLDLIEGGGDDAVDEHKNDILVVIDDEFREEFLTCNYNNDAYAPASADYRSFASACDAADAVAKHLTADEVALLERVADVWPVIEGNDRDDALSALADDVLTEIESWA